MFFEEAKKSLFYWKNNQENENEKEKEKKKIKEIQETPNKSVDNELRSLLGV